MTITNKKIYHYTTLDSLSKIIQSNCLQLSRCSGQRYDDEIKPLQSALYDILKNKEISSNLLEKLEIDNVDKAISKLIKERRNSYMSCFAEENNNAYLIEKYADDGKGVAIEFRTDYLPNGAWCSKNNVRSPQYCLNNVYYTKDFLETQIKRFINCEYGNDLSLSIGLDLYKDQNKYSSEKEIRLIAYIPTPHECKSLRYFYYQEKENIFDIRYTKALANGNYFENLYFELFPKSNAFLKHNNQKCCHAISKIFYFDSKNKEIVNNHISTINRLAYLDKNITSSLA